jgi:hypothetical protein
VPKRWFATFAPTPVAAGVTAPVASAPVMYTSAKPFVSFYTTSLT